jgi:tellurite methyltransferase
MDRKYWNSYYQKHGKDKDISKCSSFAQFCLDNFFSKKKLNIVELGSGNGRDAIFFARHQHNIIAIDQSTTAIEIEKQILNIKVSQYIQPKVLDFIKEDYTHYEKIDAFYSRFTLHSISKDDEELLLPNVYNALNSGGLFCIESRTTKDLLCGIGEYCGDNTYITDGHKRRFIDSRIFLDKVSKIGFDLVYFVEEDNLSVYKDDNPVLMRVVLKK